MPDVVEPAEKPMTVLLGLSTGRSAVAALRLAAEWHEQAEVELHLLHVLPNSSPQGSAETADEQNERAELLRRRAAAWLSDATLKWHYRTARGHPGAELTAEAWRIGAAVILLGSAGGTTDYVRARSGGASTVVAESPEPVLRLDIPSAFALKAAHVGGHTHQTIGGTSA